MELVEWYWQGKTIVLQENSVPVMSTTDTAWTRPGSNPAFRGEKLETNRLWKLKLIYITYKN
jgi:hypothetical protein